MPEYHIEVEELKRTIYHAEANSEEEAEKKVRGGYAEIIGKYEDDPVFSVTQISND